MNGNGDEEARVSDPASQVWRFGAVEVDGHALSVTVAGERVALDQSSYAILLTLLRSAGDPVSKDVLLQAGWPARIVHENSLAKAIGRLRKALGPDGRRLEAVYGTGYRLAVAAEETSAPPPRPDPAPPPPPLTPLPGTSPRRLAAFAGAGVLALGAILLAALLSTEVWRSEPQGLVLSEPQDTIGRILWVDDHPENNTAEKRAFEDRRIAVYTVRSTEEALMLLSMYEYDAVISDMGRSGEPLAGLKLVTEMRARGDETPFYLYTIMTSDAQHDLLARHGGQGIAETPEGLYAHVLPVFGETLAGG